MLVRYLSSAKAVAEKKCIIERAKIDHCKASFTWITRPAGHGEPTVKKLELR